MPEFFVDAVLYTGQHMLSRSFFRKRDAIDAVMQFRSCTMIERMDVVDAHTGEVVHSVESLTVAASHWRSMMAA